MVEYNTAAVSGINLWLWSELQSLLSWTEINGRRPISTQQDPEIFNSGSPHITYGWASDLQSPMIELKHERAAYSIYAKDISDVVQSLSLMDDLLSRWDWSAQDLNVFLADVANEATDDQKKYEYKHIHVTSMTGPEPPSEEGGYHEATITIVYAFTIPMASTANQTSGFGRMSV